MHKELKQKKVVEDIIKLLNKYNISHKISKEYEDIYISTYDENDKRAVIKVTLTAIEGLRFKKLKKKFVREMITLSSQYNIL